MAEQADNAQIIVEPEEPEYEIEQHVKYRRKQQILTARLSKLISDNLSDFRPIMNGKVYAYTTVKVRNAGITQLTEVVKDYEHLRKVDFSLNLLKEIPNLLSLKYVVHLELARNLLPHAGFLSREGVFPCLKEINLQGNKIVSMPPVMLRSLRRLNLNNNLINSLQDFEGHPTLEIIELRGNKLKSIKGLKNLPALLELYISQNEITDLRQLQKIDKLMKLNARKNKITNLSQFPQLPSLRYLNLRENQIAKVNDLSGVGQSIKTINLIANPLEAQLGDNTKKEIWMRFRNFTRINKNEVTAEEKEEFDKEYRDRLAEQEKERLEKEAAEREAREQQQKQGS